ncbi:hypothetical protein KFE25_006284 [Diacronema lutheri]|uniref:Transmembrane protein n=1 Tax=Diacronema lutheri TaxID=2081491 RepID=A0A8J5XSR2_DIALT|nr:hypothetical protein KFE25_006284 [Diacronema lutheri]
MDLTAKALPKADVPAAPSGHVNNAATWRLDDAPVNFVAKGQTRVCQVQLKRDPMPILNALQFAIFTAQDAFERVNLVLTVILKFVALVYTLAMLIPMAARTTIADGYVFNSIGVAVLTIALAVAATHAPEGAAGPIVPGSTISADGVALCVAGALHVAAHVHVITSIVNSRKREAAKLTRSFDELYVQAAQSHPTMQF